MRKTFPEERYPHQDLTGRVIGAFYQVHSTLGYGFRESIYRRALAVDLEYRGIRIKREVPFHVMYRGVSVGCYRADQIAESVLILESKTGIHLDPASAVQTLSYLKASGLEVGLILHYGLKAEVKRIIASRPDRLESL